MRTAKRFLTILALLALCLTLMAVSAFAAEEVASGTCGENLTWVLDSEGTLTISGMGDMYDCGDDSPWFNNSAIKKVVINPGVTSIGDDAFYCCTALTSIEIPEGVTWIGGSAFSGCTALTSIEIPEGVTSIGHYAFSGCAGLASIEFPEGVTSIGSFAFAGCTGLTSVVVPEGVTKIYSGLFYGCTGLASIEIPDGVTLIGSFAFYDCTGLNSIVIPQGVTSIGEEAFGCCTGLASVVIPEGVTRIDKWVFWGCTGLNNVVIPESITSIGEGAFGFTGLTSIEIPKGVTSIYSDAFYGCTGLTDVYYIGSEEDWAQIDIMDGNECLTNATIHYNYTPMLETPTISNLENKANGVLITWDAVPGAAKYKLVVKESGGSWKTIWNTVKTSYTWTGAESGKTYTFGIRCTTADGKTYTSAFDSTGKTIQFIARPSIASLQNTATGVKISWKAVPGAAKYKLVVKEPGGSWKTIRYTANTSYTWTGAVSGKTYTFGICCVTSDGKTATSAFDSTGKTIKYVAQPTISKVANMANGVAIAWNKVPGAAKYKIVVKTATSGWKTVAYSTGSTYTWTGAESGVTYTFGIVCVTADGKTVTSAFDSTGKTIKYIACPKIAKLQKVSSGIKITWNKVPGAAKYKLIVKESGGSWKTIWNTINSSYTWTGAVKGKTYIFSLRCMTADGKSYTSSWNSTGWTIRYT